MKKFSREDRPFRRNDPAPRPRPARNYDSESFREPDSPSGLVCLYGRRPVMEALRQGIVKSIEIARKSHGRIMDDILNLVHEKHIPIKQVDDFEEDLPAGQGIRAFAEMPQVRHDLRPFLNSLPEDSNPLILMLDGIMDPHNFGAILRSADAAGVVAVIIRERRQVPITDTVVKTSAGAACFIPTFQVVNLSQTLRLLKEEGFWSVAAVAGDKTIPYWKYNWNSKTVLIVGAEGPGISDLLKRESDAHITIPMHGKIESLNVSVATGILLFEYARSRHSGS